jgi:isopentenyldiphosphate isomerase
MSLTDQPDEVLDLVDQNDRVIGTVAREEVASKMLALPGYVRAADCFIVNDSGQIFVPRRSPHKKMAPNGYDFSAGEHVASGETYIQAMVRGFLEELGIRVAVSDLLHIGTLDLRALGLLPYFDAIFVYRTNTTPDYNKNDFVSHEWLSPAEFIARLKAGEVAKVNILPALELFLKTNK